MHFYACFIDEFHGFSKQKALSFNRAFSAKHGTIRRNDAHGLALLRAFFANCTRHSTWRTSMVAPDADIVAGCMRVPRWAHDDASCRNQFTTEAFEPGALIVSRGVTGTAARFFMCIVFSP